MQKIKGIFYPVKYCLSYGDKSYGDSILNSESRLPKSVKSKDAIQFLDESTKNPTENQFDRIRILSAWCSPGLFYSILKTGF